MKQFREYIMEKAPPSKEAEKWIKDNKAKFKDQYGDDWEKVLYAKAWKMFGEKDEDDPCWDGYEQYGTKKKDGKEVPNCVPEEIESEAPTNTTSGVANPDGPRFKKSKFAGYPCVEVDGDTYVSCSRNGGKKPYARWKKYIEDDELETFVKKNYHKEKRLVMKNRDTGSMTFIK